MDVLTLLAEARAAGLIVCLDGDRVQVTGPKSAEPIVRRMMAIKPAIVAALRGGARVTGCCPSTEAVLRPTVGGSRLYCSGCGRRVGADQPYPWSGT